MDGERRGTFTRARLLRTGVALGAGAGAGALGACAARGGDAGAGGPAAPAGPVTLQFLTQTVEAFPDVLQLLKEALPTVTIETVPAAGYPFVEKALALGVAGTPPDLSYANVRFIPALADAGLLHDAHTFYKRDRLDLNGVPKGVLEDYTWKGALATVPLDIGIAYVRYNRSLIELAGQPDPARLWQEKRWTWDAFVAIASALSRTPPGAPERTGFVVRTWEGDYLSIVRTFGGAVLNRERTRYTLDDSAGVAALNEWGALATRHQASPAPDQMPPGGFNAGQLATVSSHPGEIVPTRKAIKDAGAQWRWDVVPHPAPPGKRPVPTLFSNGFHLWRNAQHEAVSAEVVKRLVGPELAMEWGVRTGRQPARTSLTAEYARRLDIPAQDPQSYGKLVSELEGLVRRPRPLPHLRGVAHGAPERGAAAGGQGGAVGPGRRRNAAPAVNAILARAR